MNFVDWVNAYFPKFAIKVIVGPTSIFIGQHCNGLDEMRPEQIEWLNKHKIISWNISPYNERVTLKYRASETFEKIMWG